MTQYITDTKSRVTQPSCYSGEIIQYKREIQGEVDVQTVELEVLQITSIKNIKNKQRQLNPLENVISMGISYATAEEINKLLTKMLQKDTEQRVIEE